MGSDIQFVGGLLLRNSPINFKDLLDLVQKRSQNANFTNVDLRNILSIITKHNLLIVTQSEFDKVTYFGIDEKECLLRLSIPRYITQCRQKHGELPAQILEEIFINGSLMKSEILPIITEKSAFRITEAEILRAIEELTIINLIIGAKSYNLMEQHFVGDSKSKGGRPKKMTKKQIKEEEDKFNEHDLAMQQQAQLMEYPLRINTMRFLAEERRQSVIEMAKQKFGGCSGSNSGTTGGYNNESELDFKVFLVMALKFQSVQQLLTKDELTYQREQISFNANDVQQLLQEKENKAYNEKEINSSLDRLFQNADQYLLKINFDHKKQMAVYTVNWRHIFENFKIQLLYQIVEETMSKYHARVLRILSMKGFLEEKDITQMCLLPLKDTRSLINQLINEGYIQFQELQVKQSGQVILYGINPQSWQKGVALKVAKCNLNLLLKEKSLNLRSYCALELNHLYF
ncbi:UNKNOWN [Stylonychia lemnae]|uniref:DNA-directed RNA polymerase III subunit RPC3 n=1 Tax=Stylonychia lemnae TaxID=5949 RepID=A0A078AMQ2_STYLE|nr:UNKNOWN [Stylonychia lemnae]|eukprot:CDW83434.1 UNKNOWN [Stylonychia lemnae]